MELCWDSEDPEVVRVDGVAYLIREVDAVVARASIRVVPRPEEAA